MSDVFRSGFANDSALAGAGSAETFALSAGAAELKPLPKMPAPKMLAERKNPRRSGELSRSFAILLSPVRASVGPDRFSRKVEGTYVLQRPLYLWVLADILLVVLRYTVRPPKPGALLRSDAIN
jgi:hypothetical protein